MQIEEADLDGGGTGPPHKLLKELLVIAAASELDRGADHDDEVVAEANLGVTKGSEVHFGESSVKGRCHRLLWRSKSCF